MSGELIRRGTRNAFRSLATSIPQAAVAGFWQDEGFAPVAELDYEDSSVRRWTFQSYAERVDWTDLAQVEGALVRQDVGRRAERRRKGNAVGEYDTEHDPGEEQGREHDGEHSQWRATLGAWGRHTITRPPVRSTVTPVTQDDAGEAKYSTACAMSAGSPILPSGKALARCCNDICSALDQDQRAHLTELLELIADKQGLTPGVHPGYRH